MPPRTRPVSRNSFHPPNDAATYRDVLMFEERLKTTAMSLQRRKSRYQFFLLQLLLAIAILLWEVLLPPQASVLVIPYRYVVARVYTVETELQIHPYITSGLLFVSVTALLLFFASGMYSERISYANKYVPQANRALRSFNIVLNVRKPPLRTKFAWNPINFFFPRPPQQSPTSPTHTTSSRSPSPAKSPRSRSSSVSRPMASLPPSSNPRGELVFSSKVDKYFREGYERYRATFERKREERAREEYRKTWWGRVLYWGSARELSPAPVSSPGNTSAVPSRSGSVGAGSVRGRGGGGSRSTTPVLTDASSSGSSSTGIMMKTRDRSGTPVDESRQDGTPSRPGTPRRERSRRERDPGDMRTLALERSFEHGQSNKSRE
ncbi:hypothetical protein FA15DRAFT_672955 [Coprinopsis marcescibilis]|uniref:Transmembrane protein 188 n=1 Tax=Coprinopsis marcescibilis TaxID=230819 RepID=A0A5C3KL55_COPMA|nr:hypothetical protein FA15DRAFT_672955 [Coprinopsis marcescibilis]